MQITQITDMKISLAAYLILRAFSLKNPDLYLGVRVVLLMALLSNGAHAEDVINIRAKQDES